MAKDAKDDIWWSWRQTANYLLANYPCEDGRHASDLITRKVEDGTISTRYNAARWTHVHGPYEIRLIARDEWRRDGDDLYWTGSDLRWAGDEAGLSLMEFRAADVRELTASGPPEPVTPIKGGGRKPKKGWDAFWLEVVIIALKGELPEEQIDLVKQMLEWSNLNMDDPPVQGTIELRLRPLYQRMEYERRNR
jgi:hypothetical protein